MKKIFTIARQEFIVVVSRPEFIFTLIGVPLLFIVLPCAIMFFMLANDTSSRLDAPVALIDRAKVVDVNLATGRGLATGQETSANTKIGDIEVEGLIPPGKLIFYDELNRAQQDLKRGEIAAIYVIEPDYLTNGNVVVYARERGIFSSLINPGEQKINDLLRASLTKGQIPEDRMMRVLNPMTLTRMKIDKRGEAREIENRLQKVTSMFVPLGMIILFGSIILVSSGYLLHSTAQEKENRVMEILLASVKPSQLLAGKILGLSAVGLLQSLVYALLLLLPAFFLVSIAQVSFQDILLSLVYVLLGYFLFASLMAGTGIIGNTVQESTQFSAIWSLISVLPILFILQLSNSPNSLLAKALSYFPLTAPGTMILRIVISEVPVIDFVISMFTLIAGTYLAVKGAAKAFRVASLMYGKPPTLPEIMRWFREA